MRVVVLGLALSAIFLPVAISGQSHERPRILILGTYHMGGSGSHVFESERDDVLSDGRQAELAELIQALVEFRPTKIAVESPVTSDRVSRDYARYIAGEYRLSRNEIDQIGFRLAEHLGHETIYPVDEDGEFPFYRVRNYAIANDMEEEWDALMASGQSDADQWTRFQQTSTILEILAAMNADSTVAKEVGSYYRFIPFGEPYEYAGSDLLASWFRRNIRIYHNIRALATAPEDRVLVIYGAGHLGWLQQMVEDDPAVDLVKFSEITGKQ